MKFRIIEIDRDYRTKTDEFVKEFKNLKEAQEWTEKESWTGYDYHAYEIPQ